MQEKIKAILWEINEDFIDYQGKDMVEDGIIDSHDIFNIIVELEEKFKIEIEPDMIIPENFKTIDKIIAMVEKLILN